MTIFEKAAELGAMIKASEENKRLEEAAKVYEADEEMKSMIEKYNEFAESINARYASGETDEETFNTNRDSLDGMYDQIMQRPAMKEYSEAKSAFDKLMQRVYGEINYQITGEQSCGGNCQSCGGGCGGV